MNKQHHHLWKEHFSPDDPTVLVINLFEITQNLGELREMNFVTLSKKVLSIILEDDDKVDLFVRKVLFIKEPPKYGFYLTHSDVKLIFDASDKLLQQGRDNGTFLFFTRW